MAPSLPFRLFPGAHEHLPAAATSACGAFQSAFQALPGVPHLGEGLAGTRGLLQRERLVKKRGKDLSEEHKRHKCIMNINAVSRL